MVAFAKFAPLNKK